MTPEEKNKILLKSYKAKIASTRGRQDCDGMPIEMKLTFEQWCQLWDDHGTLPGLPWVVSRHNDRGHYEINNVSIVHNMTNIMQTFSTKQTDIDAKITQYAIENKMSRRIVRAMHRRGQITL